MKFIEMTGKTLASLLREDELHPNDLGAAGVQDNTIVRVNEHGDIEVRRPDRWDVIGGLLGNYLVRIKAITGMDWA
ncbi:MAG: hypothetical protein ACC645_05485 [Pirellulales bacterium]